MKRLLKVLLAMLTLASVLTSCEASADVQSSDAPIIKDYQTVAQVDIEQNVTRIEPDPNEWVMKYLEVPQELELNYLISSYPKLYFNKEKQTIELPVWKRYKMQSGYKHEAYALEYDMKGNLISTKKLPYSNDFRYSGYLEITDYGYLAIKNNEDSISVYKYFEETDELICVIDCVPFDTNVVRNADIHEDDDGNYYIFIQEMYYEFFVVMTENDFIRFSLETDYNHCAIQGITEVNGQIYVIDVAGHYWIPNFKTKEFDRPDFADIPEQFVNSDWGGKFDYSSAKFKIHDRIMTQNITTPYMFLGSGEHVRYYQTPTTLYAHNADDPSNPIPMVNYEACGFTLDNTEFVDVLSPTCILTYSKKIIRTGDDWRAVPAILYFDDTRESATRQVLTLAHTENLPQDIRTAISHFNLTNPNYRIQTVDYSSYDDPIAQIEKEFGTGKYPDMMFIPSKGMDFTNLTAKGFIYNLCDLGFDADSLVPSVRSAVEYGGGIYRLPMTFEYDALINNEGIESLSIDELLSMYKTHGNALFRQLTRDELWDYLLRAGILGEFVDYGNAVCSFDDESFIKLIEFLKSYNNDPDDKYAEQWKSDTVQDILDGEGVFVHSKSSSTVGELSSYEFYYDAGEYSISGFPTSEGDGIVITPKNELCIMKAAASPEGAMEFIELIYSSDEAREHFWKMKLRTNRELQLDYMRRFYDGEVGDTYFDTTRNNVIDTHFYDASKYKRIDDPAYVYFTVGDDALDYFIERIFDAEVRPVDDVGLLGIIEDELTTYLGGQGDARGTAARVQSRAKIYLSERYG